MRHSPPMNRFRRVYDRALPVLQLPLIVLVGLVGLNACAHDDNVKDVSGTETRGVEQPSKNIPKFFKGCSLLVDSPLTAVCDDSVFFSICLNDEACGYRSKSGVFRVAVKVRPIAPPTKLSAAVPFTTPSGVSVERSNVLDSTGEVIVVHDRRRGEGAGTSMQNAVCIRPNTEDAGKRCDALLAANERGETTFDVFTDLTPRAYVDENTIDITGRAIAHPDTCDVEVERDADKSVRSGRIRCEDAQLTWSEFDSLTDAHASLTASTMATFTSAVVPCAFEDATTNCSLLLRSDEENDPRARLLEGYAKVRNKALLVRCEWRGGPRPPYPCDIVFQESK